MSTAPRNTANFDGYVEVAMHGQQGSQGSADAILRQEAEGQQSFINSTTLPYQMRARDRKVLEQAGVIFGDMVPGDDLFIYVTLPAGWTKSGTSHSMHSDLLDDKGRKRAGIFYKAAFYDRRADLTTSRRFNVKTDYDYADANNAIKVDVTDGDQVVFSSQPHPYTEKYSTEYSRAQEAATDEAMAWLQEHYPNWEDTSAYWD